MAKSLIYLFNEEFPKGQMFKIEGGEDSEEYKSLILKGWVDTPAKLDLPEEMDTGVTEEQAKNARPEDLKAMLESYGFIVVTPEQLKAEAVKMAEVALDIENFADEDIIAEAERRGLKQSSAPADVVNSLFDRFQENPEELDKEELVELGNVGYTLGLRMNMKEETMIEKIKAAIESGEE